MQTGDDMLSIARRHTASLAPRAFIDMYIHFGFLTFAIKRFRWNRYLWVKFVKRGEKDLSQTAVFMARKKSGKPPRRFTARVRPHLCRV